MFYIDETPSAVPRAVIGVRKWRVLGFTLAAIVYYLWWIYVFVELLGRPAGPHIANIATCATVGIITALARREYSVTRQSILFESYLGPWRLRSREIPVVPGRRIERVTPPRFLSLKSTRPPFAYGDVSLSLGDSEDGRQMADWINHRLQVVSG